MTFQDWKDSALAAAWDAGGDKTNPTRHEQLDILLSVMSDAYQPGKWTLDLGFGSGKVEKLIFDRIPQACVIGVDSSREMMTLAAERLAPYAERYQAVEHDLAQIESLTLPEHPYQFVISIQALHHLTPEEMQTAYHYIYRVLEPGGLFLLLDRMRVETPTLWSVFQSLWARQNRVYESVIFGHEGATFAEHEQLVRGRGDLPVGQEQHLRWMRDAGFEAACLHLHGNRALIAARKPATS
jgi:ubiquinone/menaquinone biosynthesis C-methylase UbiE